MKNLQIIGEIEICFQFKTVFFTSWIPYWLGAVRKLALCAQCRGAGGWWLAVGGVVSGAGGWWLLMAAGGGWLQAVGGWRRLVAGCWLLVAAGGGWLLVAGSCWWRLVAGGWRLAANGWRRC